MELNSVLLPLREGARASITLSPDKYWAILRLTAPDGHTVWLEAALMSEKDGYPSDTHITEVRPWENRGAEDNRQLVPNGELLYRFSLEIDLDAPGGSNPYHEEPLFKVPEKQWEQFFRPVTFRNPFKENA